MSPAYDLWQVAGPVARIRVIGADGTALPVPSGPVGTNTVIGPGTSGTLVLAEPAGGWSATLNGKPLARTASPVDGWAQGFVLPAGGGRLVITRNNTARHLSLAGQAIALLVVFALALPGTRSPAPAAAAAEEAVPDAAPAPGRRRERAGLPRLTRSRPQPQPAVAEVPVPVPAGAQARPDPGPWVTPADHDVFPGPPAAAFAHPAASTGPALDAAPARDAAPGPARRSRGGGQHAARHGKPSRRQRGTPQVQAAASPPEAAPPPAMTGGVSLETLDFVTADAADDDFPAGAPGPAASWPRPPWETGDRP